MSPRVSVRLDAYSEHAVAVKTATTLDEIAALTHEAERLSSASHPGVVALIEHRATDDGAELVTRFAGEPLDRWRGTLVRLAGLGAAVAATLADLHAMGVVHGRIDGSHVLLGGDGRPRLCGLSHAGDAQPADDVADLGALLANLVEHTRPVPRPSTIAWRRGPHAERRALLHALDQARDPLPRRRLSARGFATALLAAVPGAELPPAGGHTSSAWRPAASARRPAAVHESDDGTLELDRADDVASPDLIDDVFGDQTSADLDELFADRPWRARSRTRRRHAPPARPDPEPARLGRRLAVLVTAALVCAVLGWWASRQPHEAAETQEAASPARPDLPCPTPTPPADHATTAAVSEVDVDGDGCPEPVRLDAGVVEVADDRWAIGHPDDLMALGDWDCDGRATPALYRPATGDVFVFPTWATPDQPLTVEASTQVSGGHALTTAPDGAGAGRCDVPVVELAGGGQRTVDVTVTP